MNQANVQTDARIHLVGVRKSYDSGPRAVEALRGVDLDINERGFYAIMGPSGSGKSTLLHLLAGLDRPDEGTIEINEHRIDLMNEAELTRFRRHHIGIVFQQFNLISTLTALDNITLPAMLDGMDRRRRDELGRVLLDRLGLADRAEHRPDALSGGEQQRVAIGRAIFFEPSVLFADEPTGNLDSQTSEQMWTLLHDLAEQQNMTVVMVTHEPAAAVHCRSAFVMRDGRIVSTIDVHGLDLGELAALAQQPDG